ncbi:MAG: aldehyde dehydrogenase family protein [Actinomycetes bacterium]
MFIGGKWVATDEHDAVINPATEEVVGLVARGTAEHVDLAVEQARLAHERGEWRLLPPSERADVLDRWVEAMSQGMDELSEVHAAENGSPIRTAFGFHVGYSISHLKYFADLARAYPFTQGGPAMSYPTAAMGMVRREPIGVCGAIVPWNFPLLLAIWKIGPALAAGNTMVIKPDVKTPLTLLMIAAMAEQAGIPEGVFNVVTGPGSVIGARIAEHPQVRKVAFTGSTKVGKEVMIAAAGNLKKVTLELGGKGPNIVLPDADLDCAVDGSIFAFLLQSGQACESGTRLLLHEDIHDEFVDRLVKRIADVRMGDPMDQDTDMGPLISAEQRERVLGYIESGMAQGARLVVGGGVPEGPEFERGFWVEPTVFTDVTSDMLIAREEIFGPVLVVQRYSSIDEAVAIANDTEYGLTAGLWSTDVGTAMEVAERIESGTVWINDWHMVSCEYPFGGVKQSGIGRELGPQSIDEYTEPKFVHVDLAGPRERHIFDVVLSTPPDEGGAS